MRNNYLHIVATQSRKLLIINTLRRKIICRLIPFCSTWNNPIDNARNTVYSPSAGGTSHAPPAWFRLGMQARAGLFPLPYRYLTAIVRYAIRAS
jgi:hypothetical protein